MKILIISTFFPPQNSIASLRPYSWAKYWSRDGHDVTVLTTPKRLNPSSFSMPNDGFSLREVPIPGLGILRKLFGSTPLRAESNVTSIKSDKKISLRSTIKKKLIHIASTKGIFYGFLCERYYASVVISSALVFARAVDNLVFYTHPLPANGPKQGKDS